MFNHKKYCEIQNSYNDKYLWKVRSIGYNGKWYVSEKIHGANTAMYIHGDEIFYASRENILTEENKHYNYKEVFERINPDIQRLKDNVKNILGDAYSKYHTIVVYGEIFGGSYDHPDVGKNAKASRVQKGVSYSPNNEFLAFDVAVLRDLTTDEIGKYNNKITEYQDRRASAESPSDIASIDIAIKGFKSLIGQYVIKYLDYEDFVKSLDGTNFRTVPLIGIFDTLDEALAVNEVFESKVYSMFGLPKIENNFAEGVVIKPVTEQYAGQGRVIIKKKNPKFLENNNRQSKAEKSASEVDISNYSDSTKFLLDKVPEYSNTNRLDAVLSKLSGPFNHKSFGMILGEFNKDLIKDLEKDFPDEVKASMDAEEYKVITKSVGAANSVLLRREFPRIIE